MRAIAIAEDRTLVPVDRSDPEAAPGEVVVDIARCGICGSDLHLRPSPAVAPGAVMGHELSGRIGAGVEGWSAGDRVTAVPFVPCGECAMCRVGAEHVCALVEPFAVGIHGVALAAADPSQPAMVIGAGPIGVMTALALRARGFERILLVERNEARAERARGLGFDALGNENVHMAVLEAGGGEPPPGRLRWRSPSFSY